MCIQCAFSVHSVCALCAQMGRCAVVLLAALVCRIEHDDGGLEVTRALRVALIINVTVLSCSWSSGCVQILRRNSVADTASLAAYVDVHGDSCSATGTGGFGLIKGTCSIFGDVGSTNATVVELQTHFFLAQSGWAKPPSHLGG